MLTGACAYTPRTKARMIGFVHISGCRAAEWSIGTDERNLAIASVANSIVRFVVYSRAPLIRPNELLDGFGRNTA